MRLIVSALTIALVVVVFAATRDSQPPTALAAYPDALCAGDLRHLSWVWNFGTDGPKQAIADKLVAAKMGVILKSHDGTDWMSTYDSSPDAVSGPAKVRSLADYFESRGVPFFTYAVVQGVDPIREAQMAAQVLNSGARGIFLDLEPWNGYWRGTPQTAAIFGQELRRLAPNGIVITTVEPRPWVVPNIPVAEFAAFSDAIATMDYWVSFQSNGGLFAQWGYPPPPGGVTPEFLLDVGNALFNRYNLPIIPIGQGASQDTNAWIRFVDHSAALGMPIVSTWRHGVTYAPAFDVMRDRAPGGWPALCDGSTQPVFLGGDFDGDGRDDVVHLTQRDFLRPWLARQNGSFDVGYQRPGPGYGIQSGQWFTGNFTAGDTRDDLIHLTESDYANIWVANRDGTFQVKVFRPWPGYGIQTGSWKTGDFNGDGRTDLAHLTSADYANLWLARPDGSFDVTSFSPGPGYGMQWGTWETGDFNGDGRTDLIHLTGADYARSWLSRGDGSFDVGYFSPGPGYGIQSGSWKAGDFNGDGRTDLIHLTSADYARPWLSRGDGSFDVGYAGPGGGYALHWGTWETGDFNGDGRTDLIHLTAADYARPWISRGDGSFDFGYSSPGAGYAMQWGSWQTGDFNGDGRTDLIHLTKGGYAHPWIALPNGGFSVGWFQPWPGYRM